MRTKRIHILPYAAILSLYVVSATSGEVSPDTSQADADRAAQLIEEGLDLNRKRERDRALELFTEAIRLDASNTRAYYFRGLLYLTLGEKEKALADADTLVELAPRWASGYYVRGVVYGSMNQLDKSYENYDKAIRLSPHFDSAYHGRGLVHRDRGEWRLALKDFEEAVRLDSKNPYPQRELARIQSKIAQEKAAPAIDGQIGDLINVSKNSGSSLFPVSAVSSDGDIHFVWMDTIAGNFDIFYSKWDGEEWAGPTNVTKDSTLSMFPALAIDLDGQVHLAWMDARKGEGKKASVLHATLNDGTWSRPKNVSGEKGISQCPQIAVDSAGVVHLVWYGNQEGFFELYHSQLVESEWTEPMNTNLVNWYLTDDPHFQMSPAVAADPIGNLHIVWTDIDTGTQHLFHSQWDGQQWSERQKVSGTSGRPREANVTSGPAGDLHLAWHGSHGLFEEGGDLWYAHREDGVWSDAFKVYENSDEPMVSADPAGAVHLAWKSEETSQVLYSRMSDDGWSNSVNVSLSTGECDAPFLVTDASQQVHVVWVDDRPGDQDVFYRRFEMGEEGVSLLEP